MNSQSRQTKRIEIHDTNAGLKLKLAGGAQLQMGLKNGNLVNEPDFGLFIKQIIPGEALFDHHLIQPGDQLIAVNDIDLQGSTYSRAINILRMATKNNFMSITLSSDDIARFEYAKLIEWKETKAERKLKMRARSDQGKDDDNDNVIQHETANKNPSCGCYKKHIVINKSAAGLGLRVRNISDPKFIQLSRKHHLACFEVLPLSTGGDIAESKSLREGDLLFSFNDELLDGLTSEQINCLMLREKLRTEKTSSIGYISAVDVDKFILCNHDHVTETAKESSFVSGQSLSSESEINNNEKSSREEVVRINAENKGHYHMENFLELENKFRQQETENKVLCEHMHELMQEQNRSVENMKQIETKTQVEVGSMKAEYEEIIRVMEKEITALQASETNLAPSSTLEGVQDKQIALLECECRKLVEAKHKHRTQIEQLTNFLEQFIAKVTTYNSLHNNNIVQELLAEAQTILLNQKQYCNDVDLPYGWEKASLSDGRLFYIDHANHVTSWTPPFGDVVKKQPVDVALEQMPSEDFIDENINVKTSENGDRKHLKRGRRENERQENELRDVSDVDFTHCYANVPSSASSPEML